jgi:hypothetical protein
VRAAAAASQSQDLLSTLLIQQQHQAPGGSADDTESAPLHRPASLALGFLGDHQVAFLKLLIRSLRDIPHHIKAGAKRGTFFVRKPRGGPPKKGLPKLLHVLRLSISAVPIEIAHFAIDADDPSSGLCLGASSASFGASWLCNQPLQIILMICYLFNQE